MICRFATINLFKWKRQNLPLNLSLSMGSISPSVITRKVKAIGVVSRCWCNGYGRRNMDLLLCINGIVHRRFVYNIWCNTHTAVWGLWEGAKQVNDDFSSCFDVMWRRNVLRALKFCKRSNMCPAALALLLVYRIHSDVQKLFDVCV